MTVRKSYKKQIAAGLGILLAIAAVIALALVAGTSAGASTEAPAAGSSSTGKNGQYYGSAAKLAEGYTDTYIVVKQKQLGASHYSYTESVSDDFTAGYPYLEQVWNGRTGAQLVKLTLTPKADGSGVDTKEEVLLESTTGIIRDPDVSPDGKTVVFSMKANRDNDDFHLYLYHLDTGRQEQITFGQGVSDTEPKFLPDGKIVFSSSRDEQRIDCWYTAVSNLYRCDADGSNIVRFGYEQVSSTYPTVTSDGRVLYTRWDYNDRTQMYVQAVFQMYQDGTNQTEVYGNGTNWPTTLLHTREVPGSPNKYVSIVSGHHVNQVGKLCFLDVDKGSNNPDAVDFVFEDQWTRNRSESQDTNMIYGYLYKYPYAINDKELLFSRTASTEHGSFYGFSSDALNTDFDIWYYNTETKEMTKLVDGTTTYPASQIVPVIEREMFDRPSSVDYSKDTATFYVSNVYEGAGTTGIEPGSAKYLRVVALEFRPYSVGTLTVPEIKASESDDGKLYAQSDPHTPVGSSYTSWDVKHVLGVVPINEDGSAMFEVPSETPVYFQLLDENYNLIQSMRSWSTLMPGETFSCVGCHENSGKAPLPTGGITQGLKKGVQKLQPEEWMKEHGEESYDPADAEGFSYLEVIQPILDERCITCHTNLQKAQAQTKSDPTGNLETIIPMGDTWSYLVQSGALTGSDWAGVDFAASGWKSGKAGFGTVSDARDPSKGATSLDWLNKNAYFRHEFTLTAEQAKVSAVTVQWQYDEDPVLFINGTQITKIGGSGTYITSPRTDTLTIPAGVLKEGKNVIALHLTNILGGQYFDLGLYTDKTVGTLTQLFPLGSEWSYQILSEKAQNTDWTGKDYDTAGWSTGKAGFGKKSDGRAPSVGNTELDWLDKYIYFRRTFTLTAEQAKGDLSLQWQYDEDPIVYVNGREVYRDVHTSGQGHYVISPQTLNIDIPAGVLTEGENVIAVELANYYGGGYFDLGLSSNLVEGEAEQPPIALTSDRVTGSREHMTYPISYLVLTGSVKNGDYYCGSYHNKYTDYIPSSSAAEVLPAYMYGSSKSELLKMLRGEDNKLMVGHPDTGITEAEIRAISCWIDLACPLRGAYDEEANWNTNDVRTAEELRTKQDYYRTLDNVTKDVLGGVRDNETTLTVSYKQGKDSYTTSGTGLVNLYVPTSYRNRGSITVKAPHGVQYVYLAFNARIRPQLVFLRNGEGTFTFTPQMLDASAPSKPKTLYGYKLNNIYVWLPTEEELKTEVNLAYRAIDGTNVDVSASDSYAGSCFAPENAVDGYRNNKGHQNYPLQSWGPNENPANLSYTVSFGHPVSVNRLVLYIRADFGHDTYITSLKATFTGADGEKTERVFDGLTETAEGQVLQLDEPLICTEVTLSDFAKVRPTWFAITELEVYGTNVPELDPEPDPPPVESTGVISLTTPNTVVREGETFPVTLSLTGTPDVGVSSWEVALSFNGVLVVPVATEAGEGAGGASAMDEAGVVTGSFAANQTGDLTLGTVNFRALETAPVGREANINGTVNSLSYTPSDAEANPEIEGVTVSPLALTIGYRYVPGRKPTCGEPGNKPYYTNEKGEFFLADNGEQPTTESEVLIPATGAHTPELLPGTPATCVEGGTADAWRCTVCGKLFSDPACETEIEEPIATPPDESKHVLVTVPAVPPTDTEPGNVEYYRCEVCGKVFLIVDGTLTETTEDEVVLPAGSVLLGDVNADGAITAADRTTLARYLAEWQGYEEVDLARADTNADRNISVADRTVLARYLAEWQGFETLPAGR